KIEKIGKSAFAQTKLSAICLPSTLKEIGEGAFIGTELRSIKIPSSIEIIPDWVFYNCENLKTVTIGENVTVIGDGAFNETAIEELKLPDKTMKVGYVAFADCTKLKNVKLANVKEIGNEAFVNCKELINFTITKNVQEIGEGVFIGCDSLQNISVEAGNQKFTDIGGILYDKGMTKLIKYPASNYNSSYELPSNIRVIVDGALDGCRFISEYTVADGSMWFSAEDGVLYDFDKNTLVDYPIAKNAMNFSIPDRIRKIEKSAFEDCLISGCINISANVTEIGDDAFAGCKKVNLYTVHKDNKNFKAVDGVLFSIDGTRILQYPLASAAASYTIPEDVTTVGTSAFRYSKLTEIKMGSNVKEIKKEAFRDTVITEMILPEGLVSIGESAFDTCELLKITIPESVNNISDLAFASCPRLYEIEFKSKKGIDSVGLDVFDSTNNIQNVYVPVGSTQRYKNMFIEMGLADYDEIVGER
ncbi:MAG: leucine-rich repeat domain-containing protein, partial [Firmicutes bacterium]|nr:leucine-rich repeat domain-containing protein [Bacillota bacterium]